MRPDLFDPHSVHWHGFPNASPVFDGEPMSAISINMGQSLTYFYQAMQFYSWGFLARPGVLIIAAYLP